MALVSLPEMKTYLGIPALDTTYDAFLTMQLEIVSAAVEEYCSRKFEETQYLQVFYREDFPEDSAFKTLQLAQYPLVSVDFVQEYLDEDDVVGEVITDYRANYPTAILQKNLNARFFSYGNILHVQYTSGYNSIPVLIQSVVYSIVEERYNKKLNGIDLNFGSDIQRISIPGTIGIDFDYSLENNQRKTHLGSILGNHVNVLDAFRSELAVIGEVRLKYVT